MKKYVFACVLLAAVAGCNDGGSTNNAVDETKTNAAANDSTQAPNGMTSDGAISTNPDATKTDTAQH